MPFKFRCAMLVNPRTEKRFKVTTAISLTLRLRVQALSVGVEPLETGERLSGHVAIDQHAASLPSDYLVHVRERKRDEPATCRGTVLRAVSISALQQGPRGAEGHQRHQEQKTGTGGQVHFHK